MNYKSYSDIKLFESSLIYDPVEVMVAFLKFLCD